MTLDDILQDIYALADELRSYERKYNVLSEVFYEAYISGEEPPDDSWVRDWTAWASAYKLWLRRREQYPRARFEFYGSQSAFPNPQNRVHHFPLTVSESTR